MASSSVLSGLISRRRTAASLASKISPWLMLPPAFKEAGDMVYRFYSLAEKKVVKLGKGGGGGGEQEEEAPHDDSVVVGSTQGWLALYNKRNSDLFLSNPLTRRHVKLPPIHRLLEIPVQNLRTGVDCVENVILSSPINGPPCEVVMLYGPERKLAIATLGYGACWVSSWGQREEDRSSYHDCAYSAFGTLFCSRNSNSFNALGSRRMADVHDEEGGKGEEVEDDDRSLLVHRSLVVAERPGASAEEEKPELYGVDRYIDREKKKTVDFGVRRYDWEEKRWVCASLDGLALFVGRHNSFAIAVEELGLVDYLKPNSIYFTDALTVTTTLFESNDVGVFDCGTREISSFYIPSDFDKSNPAPMWWYTPHPAWDIPMHLS